MEAKSKKKIAVIVISSLLAAVVITFGILFAVKKYRQNSDGSSTASNVGTSVDTNTYNESIALGKIPRNYDGTYKYYSVLSINYNRYSASNIDGLTDTEIATLWSNMKVKDTTGLINLLHKSKQSKVKSNNELLVFTSNSSSARYTMLYGNNPVEYGKYVGDDNLALITLINKNKQQLVSLNYTSPNDALNVQIPTTDNYSKLYFFEDIYSTNNRKLFTVTYVYKLVNTTSDNSTNSDSDLKFDL